VIANLDIGERIRTARKKANLSQIQLADAIGVESNTVSRWENGHLNIKAEKILSIATTLGVSVSYILGEENKPEEETSVTKTTKEPSFKQQIIIELKTSSRGARLSFPLGTSKAEIEKVISAVFPEKGVESVSSLKSVVGGDSGGISDEYR
jgi:transcriptional regulator with XRE-family HTH domain